MTGWCRSSRTRNVLGILPYGMRREKSDEEGYKFLALFQHSVFLNPSF